MLELIASQGLEAVTELIRRLINQAMLVEREQHLGAAPYQRTARRSGHANVLEQNNVFGSCRSPLNKRMHATPLLLQRAS